MEASMIGFAAMSLVGAASGIWGLVTVWDQKRKMPPKYGKPDTFREANDLAAIEAAVERVMDKQLRSMPQPIIHVPEPTWAEPLLQDMTLANQKMAAAAKRMLEPNPAIEKLASEVASVAKLIVELVKAIDEQGPPEVTVDLSGVEEKLHEFRKSVEKLNNPLKPPDPPRTATGELLTPTHASAPINMHTFNTVILNANEITELVPPESDIYVYSVMNLGPGSLWVRANADPYYGDPHSEYLPPGAIDNEIHVPRMLRVLSDLDDTIIVRLEHM